MDELRRIKITGVGFVATLILATLSLLVITVVMGRRRRWLRPMGGVFSALLLVGSAVATVNAYYGYMPNVAALLGWRAADQSSWADAKAAVMRSDVGPPHRTLYHGKVVRFSIPGPRSGFRARSAEVYLPPAWFTLPRPPLPVLVLLHGSPGTPEDWARAASVDLVTDRFAVQHGGVAPIVVMPDINGSFNGDTECVDGTLGNVETYLTVDVRRWVRLHLDPAFSPGAWALGGASEGGTCAAMLALRHPERFPTFLDFSGDDHLSRAGGALSLFPGEEAERRAALRAHRPGYLIRRLAHPQEMAAWFEAGSGDAPARRAAERLASLGRSRGMATSVRTSAGGRHTWRVWKHCYQDALPWLMIRFGPALRH